MKIAQFVLSTIIILGCTKEEITPRNYPRVQLVEVSNISITGFSAKADVTYSSVDINDHGFVWGNFLRPDVNPSKLVSLGPKDGSGSFSIKMDTTLVVGTMYYIRPYAKSEDHLVYGDERSFMISN